MSEFKCAGGCGRVILDPETNPSEPGWGYLPISGRWRCGQCTRELQEAARMHHPLPPSLWTHPDDGA